MRYITWIVAVFSILHKGVGTKSCETGICFNWKISNMKLTLQCKVQNSKFQTIIEDPKGHVQAICLPPPAHIYCHATYRNGTITLNTITNEITFTLSGVINRQVNGNWTCRHGTDKDIAHVEVTVLTYSGMNVLIYLQYQNEITERRNGKWANRINNGTCYSDERVVQVARTVFGRQCIDVIICISCLSFLSAFILTLLMMTFTSRWSSKLGDLLWNKILSRCLMKKIEYVPRIKKCVFAVSSVIFYGFAALYAWIDYIDCSAKWLFVVCGLVFGCLSSLLCFNRDRDAQEVQGNGFNNEEESFV